MSTVLARLPRGQQLLILAVALPAAVALAVLGFAWPAARIAPRDLPVGIIGTGPATEQAVAGLTRSAPGAFDFHLYADEASARTAIEDRTVYGAIAIGPSGITVLEASAASATVAQLLTGVGQQLASRAAQARPGTSPPAVTSIDVVATSRDDPRGLVLGSAVLPLTICSVIIGAVIALLLGIRPAWRRLVALTVVSALAGLVAFVIAQNFLGALPHQPGATWAALALTLFAVSATTAGLIALAGPAGLGVSAALMVFVGNPSSGVTSAPELLPGAVRHLGQWLPPGAGANLLRSTAYFDGNGASGHLTVLALWSAFGLAAVVGGRRRNS